MLAGAAHAQSTGLFFSEYNEVPTSQEAATAAGPRLRRAAPPCLCGWLTNLCARRPISWRGLRVPPAPQKVPARTRPCATLAATTSPTNGRYGTVFNGFLAPPVATSSFPAGGELHDRLGSPLNYIAPAGAYQGAITALTISPKSAKSLVV